MNYEPFSRYDCDSPRRRGAGEQVKRHLPFKRAETRVPTEGCSTGGPGGTALKRSEFLDSDKINGFLFQSNADRAGMCSSSSLLANFSTQARECKIKYCVPCLFVLVVGGLFSKAESVLSHHCCFVSCFFLCPFARGAMKHEWFWSLRSEWIMCRSPSKTLSLF